MEALRELRRWVKWADGADRGGPDRFHTLEEVWQGGA